MLDTFQDLMHFLQMRMVFPLCFMVFLHFRLVALKAGVGAGPHSSDRFRAEQLASVIFQVKVCAISAINFNHGFSFLIQRYRRSAAMAQPERSR